MFAVLVRQWIHDVSLPRLLWVELFVFSAMLGSTVALRDASWSFLNSAQCLVRQWLCGNDRIQRYAWFDSGSVRRLFGACRIKRNAWFDSGSGSLLVVNGFSPDDAYDSAWSINYFRYQGVRCVAMSCGGDSFSPDGAYVFAWDSVQPMKGNTPSITSSTLVDVGCVCMLNDWICSICADIHSYFQFKLVGMGRSAGSAATQVQVCGETVVRSQLLLRRCSSWIDGLTF